MDAEGEGDAASESSGEKPEWGASHGGIETTGVGPVFDALERIHADLCLVQEQVANDGVPLADLPELAQALHVAGVRLQAAHVRTAPRCVPAGFCRPGR